MLELATLACGIATLVATAAILFVVLGGAAGFWSELAPSEFFGRAAPFGVAPLVVGTLLTSGIAMAVAVPLGVLAAVYLAEFASPQLRRALEPTLAALAALPTVVFGYFALMWMTPLLSRLVPGLAEHNALSPGIVIGVMIAPMIAALGQEALLGVPRSLREAAWALGVGELQTIVRVVLPAAFPGIAAAAVLAISRAIGETMIVTIAAGHRPWLGLDPRVPIETLTTYVAEVGLAGPEPASLAYRSMFAVGTILLVLTVLTNLVAQRLGRRLREGGR